MIVNPSNISAPSSASATTLPAVVCMGIPRWEGSNYLSSTVQLMTELARQQRVMYVDYPYTYKDMWAAFRQTDMGVPLAELSACVAMQMAWNIVNIRIVPILLVAKASSLGGSTCLLRRRRPLAVPPAQPSRHADSRFGHQAGRPRRWESWSRVLDPR